MRRRATAALTTAALLAGLLTTLPAGAEVPYHGDTPVPDRPGGIYDYADYLHIGNGDCDAALVGGTTSSELPDNFDCATDWRFSDDRADERPDDAALLTNPQELFGVKGSGVNQAWEVTTGRPDVVIAVMDSGIKWDENLPGHLYKYYLNRHELPLPAAGPNPHDTRFGGYDVDGDVDRDGVPDGQPDGVFNVVDYWADPRVHDFPDDDNTVVDPGDLIRIFSDGVDDDGNGYVDDIAGWDFFENDNNPLDDVDYGHGTGEMDGSVGEAGVSGEGMCPNCMAMSLRVGDSFVADVNHFGEAVVYAVDNGAAVIQEALGTLNHTSYAQEALDHAYANGVIVNASEADEAAGHQNWPAAYDHTMVVNSIIEGGELVQPHSYLYVNGCTNFGGYTYVAIPSTSCSSDATGLSSGYSGLLQSAARNAYERGELQRYPVADGDGGYRPAAFPLSAEEAYQLWRLAADDIDFASPCVEGASDEVAGDQPIHEFCDEIPPYTSEPYQPRAASPDDYAAVGAVPTTRYQTVKGWDFFTGYGRSNAARLVRYLGPDGDEYVPDADGFAPYGVGTDPNGLRAEDRIPPEADITTPRWWHQYAYRLDADGTPRLLDPDDPADPSSIVVEGRVAANRVTRDGGSYSYVVEWAPYVQGPSTAALPAAGGFQPAADSDEDSHGPWTEVARVDGRTAPVQGELARIPVADVVAAQQANPDPFLPATPPVYPDDPTSRFQPEKFGIRLRVRVIAHPSNPADTVNNEAVRQKQVDVYEAAESVLRDDLGVAGANSGGAGSPSFHDLDGDGVDELLLISSDGLVHAYTDVAAGEELPGWPVHTDLYPGITDHGSAPGYAPHGPVRREVYGAMLAGTPAVADLDDDGNLEVLAADLEGKLYAWNVDGSRRFVASVDRSLSQEPPCGPDTIPACDDWAPIDRRDTFNNRDWGFNMAPAVGDLDGDGDLEVVAGAGDGHVYAFDDRGRLLDGWPVLLRDPAKVASVNAVGKWTYTDPGAAQIGAKVLATPTLADLDGDGDLEIVVGVNEGYEEDPNLDDTQDPALAAVIASGQLDAGNTRIYALQHTGTATPGTAATDASPHPDDQAYLAGWPTPIAHLVLELLPYVGLGTNGQSPVTDVDGDGTLEVVATSVAGPGYVLNADGTSYFGTGPDGDAKVLATSAHRKGATSDATDFPSLIGVGALVAGSMDNGGHVTIGGPGAGLKRLLDVVLNGDQWGAEDHLSLWNPTDPVDPGRYEDNAPLLVNDLQFFTPPILADVTGDGNAEIIQGTAVKDTVVAGLDTPNSQFATRYHTGGWHVNAAGVGDAPAGDADGDALSLASVTREGWLRLWPTAVPDQGPAACTAVSQWPEFGHDAFNSGNTTTDAERPYPVTELTADVDGDRATLAFTATGDDRDCGQAASYEVRLAPGHGAVDWHHAQPLGTFAATAPAGASETLEVTGDLHGSQTLLVRARDDAGNGSAVAEVRIGSGRGHHVSAQGAAAARSGAAGPDAADALPGAPIAVPTLAAQPASSTPSDRAPAALVALLAVAVIGTLTWRRRRSVS